MNRILQRNNSVIRMLLAAAVLACTLVPVRAHAADNGIPDDYKPLDYNSIPHVQMRDVFQTETVEVAPIRVNVDRWYSGAPEPIHFRIFNTTTQEEFETDTITDDNGDAYLPAMTLQKEHDYIFFAEDEHYCYPYDEAKYPSGSKLYVQALAGNEPAANNGGPGVYNYLTQTLWYNKVTELRLVCRDTACADPFEENRYDTSGKSPVCVYYKGRKMSGVKFRLVSDRETIETTTSSDGVLRARLIEGVTYMLYVDSSGYVIDSFPIVAKDKSEYGDGLYCYNHTNCLIVDRIDLYDKGEKTFDGKERVTSVRSLKDRTTVSGINFKNQLIIDRELDTVIDTLQGRSYDVFDVTAINPRRWEISRLMGTNFTITHDIPAGKEVTHVYRLQDGALSALSFKQVLEQGVNRVRFTDTSLSLYSYVIEYGTPDIAEAAFKTKSSAVYTGKAIKPAVSVSIWGKVLSPGRDYTVTYSSNTKPGTASVTVRGTGEYTGSKVIKFAINPKGTAISKLTAGKKSMKLVWKKQTAQTTGYQIQYGLKKNFSGARTVTVKKNKTVRTTIKKLKSRKKYYVRIRTYKKTGGKIYYSSWSKARTIKIK